ncbi:MAG: hypothetical protein J6T01_00115 [Kiritimatiellae bacterium]|nr:hypothetical protein [Kiritimatiellia bacterium]
MKTKASRFAATVGLTDLAGLRRGTRVRVVYPEAWVQTLEINAQRVQGVSDESLAALLAYEAGTFSGLSPENSALAFRRTAVKGGSVQYLVMQLSIPEIDGIRRKLREKGLVLAGVTHPGMLELGEDAPMVIPPPEPKTARDRLNAAMCGVLVAAALCGAAQLVLRTANARLAARVESVEAEQRKCRDIEQAAQNARRAKADLERRHAEEIDRPLRLLRARRGYSRILDALADTCPEGGMISEITSEGDYTLGISGVTTTNDEAEKYLKDLGDRLQADGFAVATLALTSMNQLPGGGPWRFRCRILPKSAKEMP